MASQEAGRLRARSECSAHTFSWGGPQNGRSGGAAGKGCEARGRDRGLRGLDKGVTLQEVRSMCAQASECSHVCDHPWPCRDCGTKYCLKEWFLLGQKMDNRASSVAILMNYDNFDVRECKLHP